MERFIRGEVVVIPFPFSDLKQSKRRPALVLSELQGEDIILCQITSQNVRDRYSISLSDNDFEFGNIKRRSNIRPNRIFTADKNIVLYKIGGISEQKLTKVLEEVRKLFV